MKIGQPLRRVLSPQCVEQLRATFPKERGWLVAAFASEMERSGVGSRDTVLNEAYERMESVFPMFVSDRSRGWYTDQFFLWKW